MIRVSKADLEKMRLELDQIAISAFWMETYTLGLQERAKRLKKYLSDLEMVATRPDTEPTNDKPAPQTNVHPLSSTNENPLSPLLRQKEKRNLA